MKPFFLDRKQKKELYIRWAGIIFLGLLFPFIYKQYSSFQTYLNFAFLSIVMCAIFWNGTMYTIMLSEKLFPYTKRLGLSIVMMFVFVTLFVCIAGGLSTWAINVTKIAVFDREDIIDNFLISLLITYFISTFYAASYFFNQWRYHLIKSERLQHANLEARFETLKTQINPHFLFNSLNALMYLVVDNPKASEYIENLSDFMRYLLQTREMEAVSLTEELELVRKYVYIQQNRFGEKLKVNIDIPKSYAQEPIPPLAVQMLVENAIKHNVVSFDNQLTVSIYIDKTGFLVVENNMKEKIDKEPSTGVGLSNIQSRYLFLTGKEIVILCENNKFIVKLPLKSYQP